MPTLPRITLLALEGGILSTLVGPLDVFTYAGRAWNHLVGEPDQICFRVRVVSLDGRPVRSLNGLKVEVDAALEEIMETDVVLVTSGGLLDQLTPQHKRVVPWLQHHYRNGAVIAGICSGSFVLAEAGLLDGRKATTHWGIAEKMAHLFPAVIVTPEALFVDEGQVLTAGGANAGTDLALHLVKRFAGKTFALACARALLLDLNRPTQACFAPLLHHRNHGDEAVGTIQDWMEAHYTLPVNLDHLARDHHMSVRNFKRRFKRATGETPLAYLQKLRMSAARAALSQTDRTVEQVAYQVGYEDVVFFRRLFKRQYGITPGAYRDKFHLDPVD